MIFSSFLSGTPQPEVAPVTTATTISSEHNNSNNSNNKTRQQQQVAPTTTTTTTSQPPGGATDRLRRLLHASASKLASLGSGYNLTLATSEATEVVAVSAQEEKVATAKEWQLTRKYTLSEVQQHSNLDDCWMVIFDKVYNITEFVFEHPGGDFILLEYAGRDATQPFLSSRHGSSAYKMLDKYWIGILVDEELFYSNNSSYCSAYSSLSWRSTPTLEVEPQEAGGGAQDTVVSSSGGSTVTNASSGCEDEDEDEEDEVISRENSLDSITLRAEPEVTSQQHTSPHHATATSTTTTSRLAEQRPSPMLMIEYHKSYAPRRQRHQFILGATETSDEEEEEEYEEDSDDDECLRSSRSQMPSSPQEKEEDADSDFGDEQRECNTCGGPSSSAAALVALATATRPQAIVRSWSSSNSSAAATTTTTHALDELNGAGPAYMSSRTFRWRSSQARWPDATVTRQFH